MDITAIKGRTVIVTGAAQGIGDAVARALAGQGASLALLDINEAGLRRLEKELAADGYPVAVFAADVGNGQTVTHTVERIERLMGPVYGLVHAAGILRTARIEDIRYEDWEAAFRVHVSGLFHLSRAVMPYMKARRNGSIVAVSSNAARVPRMHMAAYAASKAAVTHYTKCLGLELASYGIRCNVVSPGSTYTPMLRSMWSEDMPEEEAAARVIRGTQEQFRLGIPLGRLAEPDDISDAVLYLLSDYARHITMFDLCVDGGATLGV